MPWFRDQKPKEDQTPEELRGLTDEQIIELVKKGKTHDADIQALQTQITQRNQDVENLTNNFNEVRSRLQSIEANPQGQRQPRGNNGNENPDEIPSVVDDEDEAFRRRTAPVTAVALHSGQLAARLSAEQQVNMSPVDRRAWSKYIKEIEGIMAKEPPERRIFPEVWMNAFTYVKGQHFNEIMSAAQKGDNLFFSEGVDNVPTPPEVHEDKLTPQEEAIAKKMRVDPKKYLDMKKKIKVDTDAFATNL